MSKPMIVIDGTKCYLPMQSLSMTADDWYKYSDRTEDGTLHTELIGTYFNYSLKFISPYDMKSEHDKLWKLINQGKEFSKIILPDISGDSQFEGYFAQKKQGIRRVFNEDNHFNNLSFNVIQRRPSVKPKNVIVARR